MLAFLCITGVVKIIICYLLPLVLEPITSSTEELPEYAERLRPYIEKMAEKANFNPKSIQLKRSYQTDVHVNAACYLGKIKLGEPLFKGHGKWPAEIMSVLCHELGHNYHSHLLKRIVSDTVYMVILGAIL